VTLATVLTRAQFGLEAPLVRVEAHCGSGLPQFSVVGLPETAVRESRERVRAALAQGGFVFPAGRVTVNRLIANACSLYFFHYFRVFSEHARKVHHFT